MKLFSVPKVGLYLDEFKTTHEKRKDRGPVNVLKMWLRVQPLNHQLATAIDPLVRWLVKLVTPIGGTVLDPFGGSGTTAMACRYEQRPYILIEREAEYVEIIKRRVSAVAPLFGETA